MITIIIPVYNGAQFLPVSVRSALAQSYPDVEVIIVNDGSTDGTAECAAALEKEDARVRVFSIPNSGVTAARKVGVENAAGDWVCFLDVDDTLPERALEGYAGLLPEGPEIIASGEPDGLTLSEYKTGLMMRKCHPELWGKLFRADFIKAFYPSLDRSVIIGEDQIINLVLANNATRLSTVREWLYSYNLDNSASVTKRFRRTGDYEIMFERLFNRLVRPGFEKSDSRLRFGEYKMKIEGFKMVVMDGNRFDAGCPEWREVVEYYRAHREELAASERLIIALQRAQGVYGGIMKLRQI